MLCRAGKVLIPKSFSGNFLGSAIVFDFFIANRDIYASLSPALLFWCPLFSYEAKRILADFLRYTNNNKGEKGRQMVKNRDSLNQCMTTFLKYKNHTMITNRKFKGFVLKQSIDRFSCILK